MSLLYSRSVRSFSNPAHISDVLMSAPNDLRLDVKNLHGHYVPLSTVSYWSSLVVGESQLDIIVWQNLTINTEMKLERD